MDNNFDTQVKDAKVQGLFITLTKMPALLCLDQCKNLLFDLVQLLKLSLKIDCVPLEVVSQQRVVSESGESQTTVYMLVYYQLQSKRFRISGNLYSLVYYLVCQQYPFAEMNLEPCVHFSRLLNSISNYDGLWMNDLVRERLQRSVSRGQLVQAQNVNLHSGLLDLPVTFVQNLTTAGIAMPKDKGLIDFLLSKSVLPQEGPLQ